MARQIFYSSFFLVLLFFIVLFSGLTLCERGLQEITGVEMAPGAFTLVKSENMWTLTLTGHQYSFDSSRIYSYLKKSSLMKLRKNSLNRGRSSATKEQ